MKAKRFLAAVLAAGSLAAAGLTNAAAAGVQEYVCPKGNEICVENGYCVQGACENAAVCTTAHQHGSHCGTAAQGSAARGGGHHGGGCRRS